LTPATVCPLLIRLESTPLRSILISFAASNFASVVKTAGWNDMVFKKIGLAKDGEEGLELREETVKSVMEEVGMRV